MAEFRFDRDEIMASIGGLWIPKHLALKIRVIANREKTSIKKAVISLIEYAVDGYSEGSPITDEDISNIKDIFLTQKRPARPKYSEDEYKNIEEAMASEGELDG